MPGHTRGWANCSRRGSVEGCPRAPAACSGGRCDEPRSGKNWGETEERVSSWASPSHKEARASIDWVRDALEKLGHDEQHAAAMADRRKEERRARWIPVRRGAASELRRTARMRRTWWHDQLRARASCGGDWRRRAKHDGGDERKKKEAKAAAAVTYKGTGESSSSWASSTGGQLRGHALEATGRTLLVRKQAGCSPDSL
jgi:hypothetical protein